MYKSEEELNRREIIKRIEEFDDAGFDEALRGPNQTEKMEEDKYHIPRIQPILKYCRDNNKSWESLTDEEIKQFMVQRNPKSKEAQSNR